MVPDHRFTSWIPPVALKRHGIPATDQVVAKHPGHGHVTKQLHPYGADGLFSRSLLEIDAKALFLLDLKLLALSLLPVHKSTQPVLSEPRTETNRPMGVCYEYIQKKTLYCSLAGYDVARIEYTGGRFRERGSLLRSLVR